MTRRYVRYKPEPERPGGMPTIGLLVLRLSEELARAGARVAVIHDARDEPPRIDGVETIPLRHTRRLGLRGSWRWAQGLGDVLRPTDVVQLHSGWMFSNARAGWIARARGVPYVLDPHGAYAPDVLARNPRLKTVWWNLFERRLVRGARAVQVMFPEQITHLRRLGYAGGIVVVPNGLDPPADVRWTPRSDRELVYLGRIDPETKGLDILVRAFASLPPDVRPRLRLVGPDWRGRKAELRSLVDELEVGDQVTIEEPLFGAAKWDLLAGAAGFVHPSRWDACPRVVLEAAAVGVPMLITPFPLGRHFAERNAAVMVAPEPEAVAAGLRDLLGDGAAALGERATEVVRREFTWPAVARAYLNQMDAILGPA